MDKKLTNLYDKKDDPMMWELREIKIKMSKRKISAEEINKNARKVWDEFHKRQERKQVEKVSDKSSKYKRKKT